MLGILSAALCFLLLVHITCAMKLPIFSAALSCICRVTWMYVLSVKPASKWPSILDTVFTSTPFCSAKVANVCPYGIITTNRKSPVFFVSCGAVFALRC